MKRILTTGLMASGLAMSVGAETTNTSPSAAQYQTRHGWSVAIGQIGFEEEAAEREGIDDSATELRGGWMGKQGRWVFGAGGAIYFYDDNEEFRQTVIEDDGDIRTESSSANAFSVYGETGYSFPFGDGVSFDAMAGLELILASERSIDFCRDCDQEDIDIDGGFYFQPRLRFEAGNGFNLALSYTAYAGGDLEDSVRLSVGWLY